VAYVRVAWGSLHCNLQGLKVCLQIQNACLPSQPYSPLPTPHHTILHFEVGSLYKLCVKNQRKEKEAVSFWLKMPDLEFTIG
jgi:hypothetical protein